MKPQAGDIFRRRGQSFRVSVTALETLGPRRWVCYRRIEHDTAGVERRVGDKRRVGLTDFLKRFAAVEGK